MVQGVECAHVVYPLDLNLLAFCQEPSVVAKNYNGASVSVTFLRMPLWRCFFDEASAFRQFAVDRPCPLVLYSNLKTIPTKVPRPVTRAIIRQNSF